MSLIFKKKNNKHKGIFYLQLKFIDSDSVETIIRRIDSKFDRKKELDINRFIETIRKKTRVL